MSGDALRETARGAGEKNRLRARRDLEGWTLYAGESVLPRQLRSLAKHDGRRRDLLPAHAEDRVGGARKSPMKVFIPDDSSAISAGANRVAAAFANVKGTQVVRTS